MVVKCEIGGYCANAKEMREGRRKEIYMIVQSCFVQRSAAKRMKFVLGELAKEGDDADLLL
jgi:hypothetical protein